MARAITDETFGAWLVKCNPEVWDLQTYLADGHEYIDNWSVQKNYRSEMMQPGDPVVLWVTGTDRAPLQPGVWGVGQVTAPVNVEVDLDVDEVEETGDALATDPGYWLDLAARARARYFVGLDVPFLDEPVSRAEIRAVPALADAEVLRAPMMGNPNWLTRAEWEALQALLPEGAYDPLDAQELEELQAAATIQEPDPVTRRIVEVTAVRHVVDHLEADGWRVKDVQRDNVGWDLTARRNGDRRHVEVKGRGVSSPVVLLTPNELRAAREVEGWELALVTDVFDTPRLTWHDAKAVLDEAAPVVYRAVLDGSSRLG